MPRAKSKTPSAKASNKPASNTQQEVNPGFPRIEILWVDAATPHDTWADASQIEGLHATILTVGFLLAEDDTYLTVAGSVPVSYAPHETYGSVIKIPRSWTTYIQREAKDDAKPERPATKPRKSRPRKQKKAIGFHTIAADKPKEIPNE